MLAGEDQTATAFINHSIQDLMVLDEEDVMEEDEDDDGDEGGH
jgi:hypothetical protein